METLTPDKLIDTLNKNYPMIMEHAINGYKTFYDIEQEFISKINKDISINDLLKNSETKKELAYLISFANVIQYGKSYFLSQIIYNFIQMDNLVDYINIIGPLLNKDESEESGLTIEQITGGQKGGQSFTFFLKFISIIIITSLSNVTSVGTAISPLNNVSVSIDIVKGNIPRAVGYEGELDPGIEGELEKFTQQYKQPITFPPVTTTISKNITTLSRETLIKNVTQSMGMLGSLFLKQQYFDDLFTEAIKNEIRRINQLTEATTLALEEVCISFVRTSDQSLPTPLYVLLNSKMASKFEELQEKRKKILEQKEAEIKEKKIQELQITAPEPGLTEIVTEGVVKTTSDVFGSISGMFSWSSSKSSSQLQATSPQAPQPSAQQISDAYYEVEKAVAQEIEILSGEIDITAFEELARDVMTDLGRESSEALSVTNLRIYLSSICQIKKPIYIFNQTSGIIYIKDPTRSRTHLKVLAENVVSYYKTVAIKGLQRIEDGEVITDIPSEDRQINMKSLLEKSEVIIEILTNYDTGLSRTLLDLPEDAEVDYKDFFENIASMWISLKNQTIEALVQFPMTEREESKRRERERQKTILALQNEMQRHDSEMQLRLLTLAQNRELNNLTDAEWDTLNQWFAINTGGVLKMGTGVVNNVVNATTDMGNNLLDNSKKLIDNSMAGIMSVAWGIAIVGMILTIPAVLFISLRTGYITAYFNQAKRKLEIKNIQQSQPSDEQPSDEQPLRIESSSGQVVEIAPPQNTGLTIMPGIEALLYAAEKMEEVPDSLQDNIGLEEQFSRISLNDRVKNRDQDRGGKIKKHKKTRKNKKRKTRKLKHGKRRQTKQKRTGKTKRH